ncbi:unnamed protein product [Adineta steineri]|uniref:Tyrosine-protein kinase n=1 Tax=Adineta steineri TaxID=433720 RepID=A0A814E423_9BILA|nr:unnamed protein product [Adineta steineri]CAF0917891.1 unnamed protein product [Adineta steineri]CAF0962248.1 unnamed protein product [Adineta steineri]
MGNRPGSSRPTKRENKYKHSENGHNNTGKNDRNVAPANQLLYASQTNGYPQHPSHLYPNGYGGHSMNNPQAQYLTTQAHPHHHPTPNMNTNPKITSNKLIYVANYDFNGTLTTGELSFVKGDILEVIDKYTYNDWWQARNLRTKQSGYVPSNYISALNDLTACEWYFTETNRRDAERFLEQPHNGKGTFLIRPSDTNQGQESLSVLDLNKDKHFHVKHYRIRRTNQGMYYISSKTLFSSLQDLVNHYQKNIDGLCCLLTRPCRKIEPTVPADRHGLLELDRSQLTRTELLGRGNYGEVYKGKYGQREVAIKYMKTDNKTRVYNVDKFLDEAKIMKDLLHKNIVRLYGVCTQEEPIFIVTEFMPTGCLLNYLRDGQGKNLKFKTILDFAAQIANGMAYLEQKRYVHCDLAARNILVGELDVVKIADFGLAKILQGGRLLVDRESQFPIKWTAPEAATKKEYTTKSDVWSFGILLYELITHGSNPYPGMSNNEALQAVLSGYRMLKPNDCHELYYQIMCSCWQENPDNRPTFETLYMRFDEFMIQAEPSYRET